MVWFGVIWTLLILGFDSFIFYGVIRQIQAISYSTVTGTVASSKVSYHTGSKGGTTYGVEIDYTYEINGRPYAGNRYCYLQGSSSDSKWAFDAVRDHRAGAKTHVFVNPSDPADAVLVSGIQRPQVMLLLVSTPFNLIMLFFLIAGIKLMSSKLSGDPLAGIRHFKAGLRNNVRLPSSTPLYAGMLTAGVVSFVAMFLAIIFSKRMPLTMQTLELVWLAMALAGSVAFILRWMRLSSGVEDLIVDEGYRNVTLPQTFQRKETLTVSFDEISGVVLETTYSPKGGTYYYAHLQFKDESRETLVRSQIPGIPSELVQWLSKQFGWPVIATEIEGTRIITE